MATFDYDAMLDAANDLMELFGDDGAILSVKNPSNYSPSATPENSGGSAPTQHNVRAVLVPQEESFLDGKKYEWNDEYKGGTSIDSVLGKMYMTANDIVTNAVLDPKLEDTVTLSNGQVYIIKTASRLDPTGQLNMLFILDVVQ